MLSKSEKFREIIKLVAANVDSYVPSYHVLNLYANEEVTDLHEAIENYKALYKQAVEDMLKASITEEDWDEVNPGPLFYIDEADVQQCFLVIETHLVDSISMVFFNSEFDLLFEESDPDEEI